FQVLDDVAVVHDLVAHIDGRPVLLERALDDLDRAHDAGAETAGLGQNDFHSTRISIVSTTSRNCPLPTLKSDASREPVIRIRFRRNSGGNSKVRAVPRRIPHSDDAYQPSMGGRKPPGSGPG